MNHQEQFPTIWDAPLKPSAKKAAKKAAVKPEYSPLKEVFLTIWDSAKSKTAS